MCMRERVCVCVCSPMIRETGILYKVKSYQRLKKWYSMSPCLKLSIIKHGSRVSGAIQEKEKRLPLHLGVVAIEKEDIGSPSTTVGQHMHVCFNDEMLGSPNVQAVFCRHGCF